MAIISHIGRRQFGVRTLFAGIYIFLVLGALTMVYPFLLMISGSTKSAIDIRHFDAFPQFLRNDAWLYRKYLEALFNEVSPGTVYNETITNMELYPEPVGVNGALVSEWRAFLREADPPAYNCNVGFVNAPVSRAIPSNLRRFKVWLKQEYGTDIGEVNRRLGAEYAGWSSVYVPTQGGGLLRREKPSDLPYETAFYRFKKEVPVAERFYLSPEGFFVRGFLMPMNNRDIGEYNRTHGTRHQSFDDIRLARALPGDGSPKEQADWEFFARSTIGLHWLRATEAAAPAYREFLQAKHATIEALNKHYGTEYRSFAEVPLIQEPPLSGMIVSDWEAFVSGWKDPETGRLHQMPVAAFRIHSPEFSFRDWLLAKYGSVDAVNWALQTTYRSDADIAMPQKALHYEWFRAHKADLRWEFCTRNYKTVAEYILLHGRGVWNTAVYCSLAVLVALLINPLAAYALSRYRMPSSYKILLFCMCTMAFPAMVTQIPSFLMLKQFGMLNSFWALLLPGLANGYSIFLLKGFFDSLPRELYESAALDGASEWVMFWNVTMSLSTPILAVIALGAFTGAYANFMFAFVVCQDQKMWTLMVWLYQLQQETGQAVMYASLIIAAIPTFIIFVFCQNIIMRGIVVPSEK